MMAAKSSVSKQYNCFIVLFILVLIQNNASANLRSIKRSFHPHNMVEAGGEMATNDLGEPEYFGKENNYPPDTDYYDDDMNNGKRSTRIHVIRRGCIHRNGACDHRPNDCCFNSSCRCNLWGSNCRCQRMGLFQKWG